MYVGPAIKINHQHRPVVELVWLGDASESFWMAEPEAEYSLYLLPIEKDILPDGRVSEWERTSDCVSALNIDKDTDIARFIDGTKEFRESLTVPHEIVWGVIPYFY